MKDSVGIKDDISFMLNGKPIPKQGEHQKVVPVPKLKPPPLKPKQQ